MRFCPTLECYSGAPMIRLVSIILSSGASIDKVNEEGSTPLIVAAMEGRRKCVSVLLEAGADVSIEAAGFDALHYGCLSGFVDVVEVLVNGGATADINQQNANGFNC